MAFTFRNQKGSALTNQELDDNFFEIEKIYNAAKDNEIVRSQIIDSTAGRTRNDQSATIELPDGSLVCAYSCFPNGTADSSPVSIYKSVSFDKGVTWGGHSELIPQISKGSMIPSFYRKPNGNIICVFFVREVSTTESTIRQIEFSPDLSTVITPVKTILSNGYFPIGSDRLHYDVVNNYLLMPYPKLISGTGNSAGSLYRSYILVSPDYGDTWVDSGVEMTGFPDNGNKGGAIEPGIFVNKGRNWVYYRTLVGQIGYHRIEFTGGNYVNAERGYLKIPSGNALSSIKYIAKIRAFVAIYTRLGSSINDRKQMDFAISHTGEEWCRLFQIENTAFGGNEINNPNLFICENKLIAFYSKSTDTNNFSLESVVLPFTALGMGLKLT